MMGSSAGGIVTYNIGFRRPDVFGSIAVMSPYFVKAHFDAQGELKEHPFMKDTGRIPILRYGLIWAARKGSSWKNTHGRKQNV